MAVSFDCFDTLVAVDRPEDPAAAVARELRERGVAVPEGFDRLYATPQVDAPSGAEIPLPAHVGRALDAAGVEWGNNAVRRAVIAAFDPTVESRPGAVEAVEAAAERGPVAVCSNCSVPGLVGRALLRSAIDRDAFDAVVTSVGCGWRKPHPAIFERTADALDVPVETLVHVGDDPHDDGGIADLGGRAILVDETPLSAVPRMLGRDGGGR